MRSTGGGPTAPGHKGGSLMQRAFEAFCRAVELVAGFLLGAVMCLVVASTLGRYAFAEPVPDSFDIGRLLIGACLFWGFAVVGLRGGHIQVDLFVDLLPAPARRVVDTFAWGLLMVFCALLAWKVFARTASAFRSGEATFDLRLPVWPFLGLIWLGILVSVLTAAVKTVRIARGLEGLQSAEAQEIEEAARGLR